MFVHPVRLVLGGMFLSLMKANRQWQRLERIALWTALGIGVFIASQPLRDQAFAWNSQRLLEQRWQEARREAETKKHAPKFTSIHKDLLSWRNSKKHRVARQQDSPLWPLTRLSCSKITLDAIVVEGTGPSELRRGPGHQLGTSWPGGPNCVIAAHRNAFGWWFYRLNAVKQGDSILLQVPDRKYTYRVISSRIVSVHDTSILQRHAKAPHYLTLYTCTLPKTKKRLVVVANLLRSEAT